jgi:hypothetical protein
VKSAFEVEMLMPENSIIYTVVVNFLKQNCVASSWKSV